MDGILNPPKYTGDHPYHVVKKAALVAPTTPDKDIPVPPKGQRSSSFAAMVSDLEPDQSASRVHRVNPDMSVAEFMAELKGIKDMVRNNVAPAVANAKRKTMGTYSVEVSEVLMPSGMIYVLAIVTRTS